MRGASGCMIGMRANNRMQLTGSARCDGGYAPPPQLIRVFGGARRQGPEVVRIGPKGNKYTCSETDLFSRSVPLPLMTPVQGLQDATDGQDVKRGSRSGARGLGRCIDSLDVRDTGASELNRERASPRGGASTPGYSWPSVVV